MDDKFNINQDSLNKLNDMMKNGNVSDLLSQIPADVMQNFSSMINSQNNQGTNQNMVNNNQSTVNKTDNKSSFDFNNIDINTIMKMKNIIEKMNNSNDPRNNLLASLKPYLRDTKKEKLDQYANLINFARIAELLKNDNKESK